MNVDVLVVGAGPTGLMLAIQLARRGVRARIVDRHSGPAQQSRAMAVHARTLEIYEHLGIAERAVSTGRIGSGANMWANGRRTARIPIGEIGQSVSPFPFVLMLGQDDNEHILGQRLREAGLDIEWNTELTALEQQADHVRCTLRRPDGTLETVTAAWVGGCDGAKSTVRERCGIGFPGAPYEHVFFVGDTRASGPMVPGEVNVYLWRDGFHLLFPMRGDGHWRVIGILPPGLRGRENLTFDEVIPAVREEAGDRLAFHDCHWFSTYRIHHRAASRFREGRCFVLGDAAHIHSPMGGQGMNTGLQDAYNLAWKLAFVVRGADPALLDSYAAERQPVAQRLLETTDRAFTVVVSKSWFAGLFRTRILARMAAFAMRFERVRCFAFRTLSQTGIRYPASPLSQSHGTTPKGAPQPGDRFPWVELKFEPGGAAEDLFDRLDDTRFNLLVFGAGAASSSSSTDLMVTHVVSDDRENARELARVQIQPPTFYLLRPDGHVGLCGQRLEAGALDAYFRERVHLQTAAASSSAA